MDPNLPAPRALTVVQLPDGSYTYADPASLPAPQAPPQQIVQHIHHAPPDRTVQRLALGSGIGAGTVAAGVYFGPLLVGVLTAIAANLALLAFLAAVMAWGVVTVVKSVGGSEGKAASKTLSRGRRRR
ncbi:MULTISPECIES: DUF6251 family protein [unclassified Streptomyces]|uniref:DUF6251 family protein n=1 Tax=unclassified Streptomyces TaxID=2593676 RepID=UPI000804AC77|nr:MULTISPECIES: DUF6251 family protein [unclassified Streptomyces]MYR71305.1 hypothetical protein [Streptomyces sp. SID4925]SBV02558.1 hypothetical protein YUMDRAFT_02807 [Streptomyces sp. OspMP-M45]